MASATPAVVSLDLQEDDSTVIRLRVNRQWIYAEANSSDLEHPDAREQYKELMQGHRREQDKEDRLEHEEAQSAEGRTKDSGYGSGEDAATPRKDIEADLSHEDGKELLKNWMLEALANTCDKISKQKIGKRNSSLSEWYDAQIHFFNITASAEGSGQVSVEPRDDLDGKEYIRDSILPHIQAPKYLQDLNIPWYAPEDIIVEEEREDLHASIHPTVLSVPAEQVPPSLKAVDVTTAKEDDQSQSPESSSENELPERVQYFFKMATDRDASAVKREIKVLEQLRKKDLYSKGLRAPHLAGLVQVPAALRDPQSSNNNARSELLGILVTMIPPPAVPLQEYIDASIPQEQRAAYAAESQTMVDLLHEHGIVWGDAKADNFLVDGKGKLWMIDFGGSYTPGWIDAELADTVEGDDMGAQKIALALEYPDEAVESGESETEEDESDREAAVDVAAKGSKRKRDEQDGTAESGGEESTNEPASQRRRK